MDGIYIPDMEVPTKCPCSLIGVGYDMYCYAVHGIPARVKEYNECCENETKPSWCPILPAADVAPVVHAHWIWLGKYSDGYNWRCSACRRESTVAINYCPFCGAKMDEEGNND